MKRGEAHYQEEILLEDILSKLGTGEDVKAGLEVDRVEQDRALVDPSGVRKLWTPGASLGEIPDGLQRICVCMTLYYWGVSLSRLGM